MIISILGTAGRNWKTKELMPVFYDCDILTKKSGRYLNSTDMLLHNFDDKFFLLGTKVAIAHQKELLQTEGKDVTYIEISDTKTDDIYEEVLKLLETYKEETILDVTHGFRHQPIAAIFAATLYRFMNHSNLKILFAKEAESKEEKQYEYVLLDDYLVLSQLSFQLSGFLQTLNFVESAPIAGFDTSAFERFSDALLANDFTSLCKHYAGLKKVLLSAQEDPRYKHLSHLFKKILDNLSVFESFDNKAVHSQYLSVAALLLEKNYLLLALTYMFEALRSYSSTRFYENGLISKKEWEKNDAYYINQDVVTFITQKRHHHYRENKFDKAYPDLYENNAQVFGKLANLYESLRSKRNHLTHINLEASKYNIELTLKDAFTVLKSIIDEDILRTLTAGEER